MRKLIDSGVWPNADTPWQAINLQELRPILGVDAAHALSPIDDRIILMKPPFHTIADEVAGGNRFWVDWITNPEEIDYAKAVIIADFGLGSDSPIILYYGRRDSPVVMYLRWMGNGDDVYHHWVKTHDSFAGLVQAVGLSGSEA